MSSKTSRDSWSAETRRRVDYFVPRRHDKVEMGDPEFRTNLGELTKEDMEIIIAIWEKDAR